MRYHRHSFLFSAAITAGLATRVASGQSFQSSGTDFVPVALNGKVVTNAHNDALGTDTLNVRVSAYFFQTIQGDPNFTQDPGFNTPTSGLPAGTTLSYDILDSLKYFNGIGPVVLGVPTSNESLIYNFAVSYRTLNASSGAQAGFNIGGVSSSGALHKHLNAFLADSTGSYDPSATPAPGIYVSEFRMKDTALTSSDPIFNVYDNGLPNAAVDRTKFYLRNNFAAGSNLVQNITSMVGLSALPGETNLATGGQVSVNSSAGTYTSEIDELTANVNKGSVVINTIPGSRTVEAMLWLSGTATNVSNLIANLNVPEAYVVAPSTASASNPLYSDIQALLPSYPGFSALVEFTPTSNNTAFTWDFSADQNVLLDRFAAVPKPVAAVSSQWALTTGGAWGISANWTGGQIPTSAGDTATFATGPTSSVVVSLDSSRTVGHILFNNVASYTIGGGGGTLTIDDTGGTGFADINVTSGNHTIAAPVVLAGSISISTAHSTSLSIIGAIGGAGPLTKAGAGVLTLSGGNTYGGGTNVSAGTLTLAGPGAIPINSSLTIGIGAVAVSAQYASSSPRNTLFLNGLKLAGSFGNWAAKLDLTNNDLDISGGALSTVFDQIRQGFNSIGGGNWDGTGGITSSVASADPTHLTALGVIINSSDGTATGTRLFGSGAPLGLFDGGDPSATDILVRYTYFGDANLDGRVDGSDYSKIDSGYNTHVTGWANGDFNYDGAIDGSDYTLIDNAFNTQGSQIATGSAIRASTTAKISAVPEPTGLMSIVAMALMVRRKRK